MLLPTLKGWGVSATRKIMKLIESEFKTNANGLGVMNFKMIRRGVNPAGKAVYIYFRSRLDGRPFNYEVFIPSITKAGTIQKFPNGSTRTIEDDTENYPGASSFGRTAWECYSLRHSERRYNDLMNTNVEVESIEDEPEEKVIIESAVDSVKHRGRPKGIRPVLTIPDSNFSVNELAELNKVEYITASVFVKDAIAAKQIQFVRTERRNVKGKPTNIYNKV